MATNDTKIKDPKSSVNETAFAGSDQHARIAELAYYKAEKRGFEPGHEQEDWYESERGMLPKGLQETQIS